jgi:hypothetical protein
MKSSNLSDALCASSRMSSPLTQEKRRKCKVSYPTPLFLPSQMIHRSILSAQAASGSFPPATTLPTPERSKKTRRRRSQCRSENKARTPLGLLLPHASNLEATSQCKRTWDLIILCFCLKGQNQQRSLSCLRMRWKYTADFHLIWEATLANPFRVRSKHDFFGAGGGIDSLP